MFTRSHPESWHDAIHGAHDNGLIFLHDQHSPPFQTHYTTSSNFSSEITAPVTPTPPLASITEAVPQPSQHIPAPDVPQHSESHTQPNRPRRRQPRYTAKQWDDHRPKIKETYIDQNASLERTMQILSEDFDFRPSVQMYKKKLKQWKLWKYLPKEGARWMLNRAEQRKGQHRGTIFEYGGQVWTIEKIRESVQRAKFVEGEAIDLDAPTPYGITYKTPHNVPPSPQDARSPQSSTPPARRWAPAPPSSRPKTRFLRLTWNGHTLAEIEAIKRGAHQLDHEGDVQGAEEKFREALAGFESLLSPTHEDTNATAYQLATFYAKRNRMDDADLVLDWMAEKHVERWSLDHHETMTHFLRVAELFNSWSRNDDARTLLYRVIDALGNHISAGERDSTGLNPEPPRVAQPHAASPQTTRRSGPEDIVRAFTETEDPERVNYQLSLANAHARTKGRAAEPLLLRLIEQCEKYPGRLDSQVLQANCALVDLYHRLGDNEQVANALGKAQAALEKILASTPQKTELLLESCTQVARLHIENDHRQVAEDIYERIGAEAEDTLGTDHQATIRILIHIGKTYQAKNMWTSAQPWFERALAASITANGLEGTVTKSLEAAIENKHYSESELEAGALAALARLLVAR